MASRNPRSELWHELYEKANAPHNEPVKILLQALIVRENPNPGTPGMTQEEMARAIQGNVTRASRIANEYLNTGVRQINGGLEIIDSLADRMHSLTQAIKVVTQLEKKAQGIGAYESFADHLIEIAGVWAVKPETHAALAPESRTHRYGETIALLQRGELPNGQIAQWDKQAVAAAQAQSEVQQRAAAERARAAALLQPDEAQRERVNAILRPIQQANKDLDTNLQTMDKVRAQWSRDIKTLGGSRLAAPQEKSLQQLVQSIEAWLQFDQGPSLQWMDRAIKGSPKSLLEDFVAIQSAAALFYRAGSIEGAHLAARIGQGFVAQVGDQLDIPQDYPHPGTNGVLLITDVNYGIDPRTGQLEHISSYSGSINLNHQDRINAATDWENGNKRNRLIDLLTKPGSPEAREIAIMSANRYWLGPTKGGDAIGDSLTALSNLVSDTKDPLKTVREISQGIADVWPVLDKTGRAFLDRVAGVVNTHGVVTRYQAEHSHVNVEVTIPGPTQTGRGSAAIAAIG